MADETTRFDLHTFRQAMMQGLADETVRETLRYLYDVLGRVESKGWELHQMQTIIERKADEIPQEEYIQMAEARARVNGCGHIVREAIAHVRQTWPALTEEMS